MWHIKESTEEKSVDFKVKNKDDIPRLVAEMLKSHPAEPKATVNIQIVYRKAPIPPQAKKPGA